MSVYQMIVADDHEIFRQGLKSLIAKDPELKIVGEASDGEDLLNLLNEVKCDLLVTDLSMPKMDGMSAIKEIRRKYPQIKIVVLTMLKDHEHFKHAMASGACGYLLKEDAYEQFTTACKRIVKGKQYVSPSVASLLTERYLRSLDETEDPAVAILTKREQQILQLVAKGLANKNIAEKLHISIRTVETHRSNLSNKLGIKNTASLVKYAISKGLI
jgi:DNA-binding NarL/FixJ family response regulator